MDDIFEQIVYIVFSIIAFFILILFLIFIQNDQCDKKWKEIKNISQPKNYIDKKILDSEIEDYTRHCIVIGRK